MIETNPFPWQDKVMKSIAVWDDDKGGPDRHINVIVDKQGNHGKSKLIKYLAFKKIAAAVPAGTATQLKTYLIQMGPFKAYMVDLPRVSGKEENFRDVMSTIEALKNGFLTSAMYGVVKHMFFSPPHVWVMMNEYPPYFYASEDRWNVFELNDVRQPLTKLTLNEYKARFTLQAANRSAGKHLRKVEQFKSTKKAKLDADSDNEVGDEICSEANSAEDQSEYDSEKGVATQPDDEYSSDNDDEPEHEVEPGAGDWPNEEDAVASDHGKMLEEVRRFSSVCAASVGDDVDRYESAKAVEAAHYDKEEELYQQERLDREAQDDSDFV